MKELIQGFSAHYTLTNSSTVGALAYKRDVTALEPYIRMLSQLTQVVWMHQYPVVEFDAIKANNMRRMEIFNTIAEDVLK